MKFKQYQVSLTKPFVLAWLRSDAQTRDKILRILDYAIAFYWE